MGLKGIMFGGFLLLADEKACLSLGMDLGNWILRLRIMNGYSESCSLGYFFI
jgi:hypothetical protein